MIVMIQKDNSNNSMKDRLENQKNEWKEPGYEASAIVQAGEWNAKISVLEKGETYLKYSEEHMIAFSPKDIFFLWLGSN